MSFARVAAIGLVLSSPALWGMYEGSVDPDVAGIRLGIALVVAAVVDRVLRVFVSAAAPTPVRQPAPVPAESDEGGSVPVDRRR